MDQVLENIGAGAKTATGYGRFKRCEQTESRLKSALIQRKEEQAEQVSSIPAHLTGLIAEEMIKDQYDADPEMFLSILKTKWLIKMQADDTFSADQQRIAQLLKNWYQVPVSYTHLDVYKRQQEPWLGHPLHLLSLTNYTSFF